MRKKWIFWAPLAIGGMLLFIAIGGAVVQQLWNWLTPAIFGWRQITFWQAVGLLALCPHPLRQDWWPRLRPVAAFVGASPSDGIG